MGAEHRSLQGALPTGSRDYLPKQYIIARRGETQSKQMFAPNISWCPGLPGQREVAAFPLGALLPPVLPCSRCAGFLSAAGNADFRLGFPALKPTHNLVLLHLMDFKQSGSLLVPNAYEFPNVFSLNQPSSDS